MDIGSQDRHNFKKLNLFDGFVFKRGQAVAQAGLVLGIDTGDDNTRAAWQAVENNAPRVYNHAVAMRFAAR